jgi:sigma-E factor negative regulatory protein RseA
MDKISALMDGELDREEAVRLIPAVKERMELRETWVTYHLIGEALRGEKCGDTSVASSVARELVKEPTVLAPRRLPVERGKRWALSGMAAAAAVATVTWVTIETRPGGGEPAVFPTQIAFPMATPQPIGAFTDVWNASIPSQILLPARPVDVYLQAHQEYTSPITRPGMAPDVRPASSRAVENGR